MRKLYRSAEDMSQARNLKPLKLKAWFKNKRGGEKVTARKDFPLSREARDHRPREVLQGEERKDVNSTGGEEGRHMVVETPVFIPYTKDSVVRRKM